MVCEILYVTLLLFVKTEGLSIIKSTVWLGQETLKITVLGFIVLTNCTLLIDKAYLTKYEATFRINFFKSYCKVAVVVDVQ